MVQFPEGYGEVGRNVYHRMRECRTLHELSWWDVRYFNDVAGRALSKRERGMALNDQRSNTVADLAAVLGGLGKGNKMRPETILEGSVEDIVASAGKPAKSARAEDVVDGLLKATVFWSDALDQNYAKEWTPNVSHATFAESEWQPIEKPDEEDDGPEAEDGAQQETAPADLRASEEARKISEQIRGSTF